MKIEQKVVPRKQCILQHLDIVKFLHENNYKYCYKEAIKYAEAGLYANVVEYLTSVN